MIGRTLAPLLMGITLGVGIVLDPTTITNPSFPIGDLHPVLQGRGLSMGSRFGCESR